MRSALSVGVFLAASLPAQITAAVDDIRSHGVLADSRLSLDEAIQLANGSLLITALSPQERARLSGVSGVVSRIEIDAATTPVITLERLLSNVVAQHHAHVHVEIEGIDGPTGTPVIEGGTQAIVLPLRTNHAHIHNLVLHGGLVGVEFDTTLHYHPSEYGELGRVRIEGARDVGLRVINPRVNGSQSPIRLHEVHIHGSGIGIEVVDQSQFGNTEVFGEHVEIDGCEVGVELSIDSTGGDHILELLRSQITAVDDCVVIGRVTSASSSRWRARMVHGSYRAFDRAFDVVSTAAGRTTLELHHLDVQSGVLGTSYALNAGPSISDLNLLATECVFRGPILIAAGTATSSVRLLNDRFEAGALSLTLAAGSGSVEWSNFTSFPIAIESPTSALPGPIVFSGCELVRSDLNDRTAAGRTLLDACFLGGSVLSSNVQSQRPQLAPWTGRATVLPKDPPIGTFIDLTVDLYPGTAAAWLLGSALESPITGATPFRFYLDVTTAIALPGLHQLNSRVRLPIPAVGALRNRAFYFQPVQLATQGQPLVPPVYLPPGGLVEIQ